MSGEMLTAVVNDYGLRQMHHRLTQQFGSLFLAYRHGIWWF